ncbi:ABC transporter ATP-binding protein [Oribacterium sp. oral taxon 108]|uniref:ABC transporter ATP-binding protein n=1 Tax=Oribacterium sp. oral taxon 108 TaxID=712414 RepID=UPI00020DDB75|nr:ABC transporter ATP-binding protein [Oribacterium sp. oral taxon 108]EGL38032.1 ABC transporter, ATP-binding protein [Oribacterium sp. oral taxon 108 str. F0425]
MKRLLSYISELKGKSIIAPLFKCLESLFELFVPMVISYMIDSGIQKGNTVIIWRSLFLLLFLALIGLSCAIVAQYFAAEVAMHVGQSYRNALFHKVLNLSYSNIDEVGSSSLLTRLGPDIFQIESTVNMVLRLFLRSPFIVFGAVIMAFRISPSISLLFILVLVLLSVLIFGIMLITMPLYKKIQVALERITKQVRENILGVRVIRAFYREKKEEEGFQKSNEAYTAMQVKVGKISSLLNPLSMLIIQLGLMGILYFSSRLVNDGRLFQGNVVALTNYMSQILAELLKLANLIILILKGLASLDRVEEVFAIENEQVEEASSDLSRQYGSMDNAEIESDSKWNTEDNTSKDEEEAIVFQNVSFSYGNNGEYAVSDLNFSIKKGESLGIIGGTGSGKTTLISLLSGFYPCYSGEIRLFGKNQRNYVKEELFGSIALVPQKAVLFSGTVRENLLWREKNAQDKELWEALDMACAKEFIEEKGKGLELPVTEEGKNFSGGQRQRLCIARALVGEAKFLILDDSSSALDFATERKLRHALSAYKRVENKIIISQRVASIRDLDKIIVMDQGKIVGMGKHKALLESSPVYKEICLSQLKKEEL